jgi:hypothetical protein
MTPEQTFEQLLGLGKAWRVVEARLEASSSTFVLSVEETGEMWPEESARAGTKVNCHDYVEPMQWRHLNVFNKECVIVSALPARTPQQRWQGLPCQTALGGAQQVLHLGVRGLRREHHA